MKVFKGIFTFLFVVGVSFMIVTLGLASEHKRTFTEEISSWVKTEKVEELPDNTEETSNIENQIKLQDNVILIK